jgi:O-antigen ligase
VHEDKDILATMRTSPVIGYGFGKPMLVPYSLANISAIYVFWNIMPHDSILWVWMRMGTIGYALFWLLISGAILQATGLARDLREPAAQGLALLVLLTVIQEIIFGYLDLQWVGFRNLITMGVCFALLANLRQWVQIEEGRVPGRRGAVRSGLGDR